MNLCAYRSVLLLFRMGLLIFIGAARPAALASAEKVPTTPPRSARSEVNRSQHWSLQPLRRPAPPPVANRGWVRNPIDQFILAKLEEAQLHPSTEADRITLIRRLSFDLTGLPPTPKQVEAFAKDQSPTAFEELVESLLRSPQYGERWGRHWLDVVRYTESQGFEYDHMRETAWHYRDYVLESFNEDKPYDRFMREQIAGDTLEPITPNGVVATSLLVCGAWDQAGNSQANVAQRMTTREEEMEDLLSVVGQTFLGLTLNCARCHAHKFDPIPQEDYYRIKSVFDGVRHGERVIAPPAAIAARQEKVTRLESVISGMERRMAEWDAAGRARVLALRRNQAAGIPENKPAFTIPAPIARWTFDGHVNDVIGSLHGTLRGGATLAGGRLRLNGADAFVESVPLRTALREKTLEVWLTLPRLDQGGGGAMTIEALSGAPFDSIVFGERQPKKWMAGSEGFQRTKDLDAAVESAGPGEMVHLAIAYRSDNSIAVYRDGRPYGAAYKPGQELQRDEAGQARVLFGKRHTGGAKPFLAADLEEAALYDRALTADEIATSWAQSGLRVSAEEMLAALSDTERHERIEVLAEIERARAELKGIPPLPVSYAGVRQQPEPTRRLKRGDVRSPEEMVTPGALSAIVEPDADLGLAADAPEAERRRRFAEWLADRRNPLPARVMANRVWQYHFGHGLVSTPNDFGSSGAGASHPELLDWLASEFIARGWSVKALHRLMVSSAAYRQASTFNPAAAKVDADNQLLWRFRPHRLEAEAVRDAMLAVSGDLNYGMGGPGFRPFDTKSFNATFYLPADKIGPQFDRRTVYRMNVNSGKDPMLEAFDCPDPSVKTPRRGSTTTPLQALSLLNNSFVQRQAARLAERVLAEKRDFQGAIRQAYRYCLARPPSAAELKEAEVVAGSAGLATVCWALLNSTEFVYVR